MNMHIAKIHNSMLKCAEVANQDIVDKPVDEKLKKYFSENGAKLRARLQNSIMASAGPQTARGFERMKRDLNELPAVTADQKEQLRQLTGLGLGAHKIRKPLVGGYGGLLDNNAFYMGSPEHLKGIEQATWLDDYNAYDADTAKTSRGGIFYAPQFDKLNILAHEYGHAKSKDQGYWDRSMSEAKKARSSEKLYNALRKSILFRPVAGMLDARKASSRDKWQNAVRAEERRATTYANQWLDKMNLDPGLRKRYTDSLNAALETYGADPVTEW